MYVPGHTKLGSRDRPTLAAQGNIRKNNKIIIIIINNTKKKIYYIKCTHLAPLKTPPCVRSRREQEVDIILININNVFCSAFVSPPTADAVVVVVVVFAGNVACNDCYVYIFVENAVRAAPAAAPAPNFK